MGTYCRTHGALKAECGCDITCDRAHALLIRLTAHTPTPQEILDMEQGTDWPSRTRTDGQETLTAPQAGNPASEVSKALRQPHKRLSAESKPRQRPWLGLRRTNGKRTWWVILRCCDENWPNTMILDRAEALDLALAHVREMHTGTVTVEFTPDFSGWHAALNRAHRENGPRA